MYVVYMYNLIAFHDKLRLLPFWYGNNECNDSIWIVPGTAEEQKMDKIKFAQLIAYIIMIAQRPRFEILSSDMQRIDDMITEGMPQQEAAKVSSADVDELMKLIADGGATYQKIDAIRYYRKITGVGLKESKNAVEKYWVSKPPYTPMDGS